MMSRRLTAIAAMVAACALIAAACTPTGPASRTWRVKATTAEVIDQEDFDPGDEPYAIQLGFRSKLGVANSSWVGVYSDCPWFLAADNVGAPGTTVDMDSGNSDIVFPDAQNLDIGDVLFGTAPLEIFGTMTFLMERDVLFDTCGITDLLNTALVNVLRDSLNVLIAGSATPPTEQQLVDLLVNNIDSFITAAGSAIGVILEGLGNPDDVLGVAVQIHLPTAGTFTNLLDFGFSIAGLDNGELPISELPDTMKVRVGHLLPSSATFNFAGPGYEYNLTTAVAP